MTNKKLQSTCAICDAIIPIASDVQETEVITCPECKSRLVIDKLTPNEVMLSKAPEVEEDWGE